MVDPKNMSMPRSPDEREELLRSARRSHAVLPDFGTSYVAPDVLSGLYIVKLDDPPKRPEIERVKSAFPGAAAVLEFWVAAFEHNRRLGATRDASHDRALTEGDRKDSQAAQFAEFLRVTGDGSNHTAHGPTAVKAAIHVKHYAGRMRDYRHHLIDDAYSFDSLRSVPAGKGAFFLSGLLYEVKSFSHEGYPLFERSEIDIRATRRHHDHLCDNDQKYWRWPSLVDGMKRLNIEAGGTRHAVDILLQLSSEGHRKVFIKGQASKTGTWVCDIEGVTDRNEMLARYVRAVFLYEGYRDVPVIIQEHLPFTHEQRCFVYDGRLVTAVCSDRNFNGSDTMKGRRLDERVARLVVPEVDGGSFDRGLTTYEVNRPLAAEFARQARKVVSGLRREGHMDYVIDMGLTSRGVMAIEVNSFYRSGPYCLDRNLLAKAFLRKNARLTHT